MKKNKTEYLLRFKDQEQRHRLKVAAAKCETTMRIFLLFLIEEGLQKYSRSEITEKTFKENGK